MSTMSDCCMSSFFICSLRLIQAWAIIRPPILTLLEAYAVSAICDHLFIAALLHCTAPHCTAFHCSACAVPSCAVLCCAASYCCLPHVRQTALHRGGTGHRRYPVLSDDDEEEDLPDSFHRDRIQQICRADNSLQVWQYKATWNQVPQAEQQL